MAGQGLEDVEVECGILGSRGAPVGSEGDLEPQGVAMDVKEVAAVEEGTAGVTAGVGWGEGSLPVSACRETSASVALVNWLHFSWMQTRVFWGPKGSQQGPAWIDDGFRCENTPVGTVSEALKQGIGRFGFLL